MTSASIKKLLLNLFIAGFEGEIPSNELKQAISSGLGGVIFFSDNIKTREAFKKTVSELKALRPNKLITSIDQEGGLVERTINLEDKVDYLSARAIANIGDKSLIAKHYEILAQELADFGINMNFAPDVDVNTIKTNSIIGLRSFADEPEEVCRLAKIELEAFKNNGILSVAKHFPGHGHCSIDSHISMPEIDLSFDELEKTHIKPFKAAIENGVDALMVAHATYNCFNPDKTPASLSKEVIGYLRNNLKFEGLIVSDDMVMGAIALQFDAKTACIKAIKAGVNMLIFRNFTKEIEKLIDDLAQYALIDDDFRQMAEFSYQKVKEIKDKIQNQRKTSFNSQNARQEIEAIAQNSIKIIKNSIKIGKNDKILILRPKRADIHHFKTDSFSLSEIFGFKNAEEQEFSLKPSNEEITYLSEKALQFAHVLFVSYNATLHKEQQKLIAEVKPKLVIVAGVEYDDELFGEVSFLANVYGYKKHSFIHITDEMIIQPKA